MTDSFATPGPRQPAVLGTVPGLSIRSARAAAPVPVMRVEAVSGTGLLGDAHADALSPRQLLLSSAQTYAALDLAPHTLRENLLLDIDTAGLVSGTVLQLGEEATIRLMFQCEACGQLDALRPGLSKTIGARRGMLARVLSGGVIRGGDPVRSLGVLERPWLDDWRMRVRQVLDAVPDAMVVEYRQLARLAGVQSSYCRAFPRLLAGLGDRYAAKAVASHSPLVLPRWNGTGLFDLS